MKYIFINPVVDKMYVRKILDQVLLDHGYQRVEVHTDWHKIVKEKYAKVLEQTNLTILDRRCPKAIETVRPYFNHKEMLETSIEPILIHCAMELASREDLKGQKKMITTPCESLANYGNQLNLEDTEFISWKIFLNQLKLPEKVEGKVLDASPIPPGYFTSLGIKSSSLSGQEKIEDYFKAGLHKQDRLVEMLYCHNGCHNGDGVLIHE